MSVESDLRKDGIEVIKKLDTLKVNSIARNVALRLCETFPDFNLNQNVYKIIKIRYVYCKNARRYGRSKLFL